MGKFYFGFLSIFFIASFTSCKKSQPAPAYVYIPEITVNSSYNINGSNSSDITHVKVFNENELIGVYELPINVPVLDIDQANIQCIGLINNNGSATTIVDYIFYEPSTNEVFLESEKQDTIFPVVVYNPISSAEYWFEDFEGAGHAFLPGLGNVSEMFVTENPTEVFEGAGSAKFDLASDTAYSKYLTDENFSYAPGKAAFLELDYKNNQTFFFSLILHSFSGPSNKLPVFQFKSTINDQGDMEWNKIYIELGSILNNITSLSGFDICFEMERDLSVSDATVLIDNVKVIKKK